MHEDTTLLDVSPPGVHRPRRRAFGWALGLLVALAVAGSAGAAWIHRSTAPAGAPIRAAAGGGDQPGLSGREGLSGGGPAVSASATVPPLGPATSDTNAGTAPTTAVTTGVTTALTTGLTTGEGPATAAAVGTTSSIPVTFHPGTTVFASAATSGASGPGVTPGATATAGVVPVGSVAVGRASGSAAPACPDGEVAYSVAVSWDRSAAGSGPSQFHLAGRTLSLDPGVDRLFCAAPGAAWSLTYPDGGVVRSGTL